MKESLTIRQKEGKYTFTMRLAKPDYEIRKLLFLPREEEHAPYEIDLDGQQEESEHVFSFRPADHPALTATASVTYDLSFLVRAPRDAVSEKKIAKAPDKYQFGTDAAGYEYIEYPVRLGKFEKTEIDPLEPIEMNGIACLLFVTIKGNLSLAAGADQKPYIKTELTAVDFADGCVDLQAKLWTKNSWIEHARLLFKSRNDAREVTVPAKSALLEDETKRNFGLNHYTVEVKADMTEALSPQLEADNDVMDLYFELQYHDFREPVRIRVGKPSEEADTELESTAIPGVGNIYAVSPYYTIKYKNLTIELERFTEESYHYMEKTMKRLKLLRPFYAKKDIWIVGERPYKAQDTGFHFFKYMRENHPEKNVHYVIDPNSPELANVEKYGNILHYKSEEHILYTLMATRIISSHHPEYIYPIRSADFAEKVQAKKVFLQHGVLGVKNISSIYGAESADFETDLFIVSSDFEKQIVVDDLHYGPEQVAVTGLSRFDQLFKDDVTEKRQLLIIPTWREWLSNEEQFKGSKYFETYSSLVNSPELLAAADEFSFEIVLCLHPNMQNFSRYFADSPVTVINQGEVNVQQLLKESAMMITDYSSVAFDFSFLGKPVVYYQFDKEKYIEEKGSHINLEADLPGDIATEETEVVGLVRRYGEEGFAMQEAYKERAAKFLKYKDEKASERIFRAIDKM